MANVTKTRWFWRVLVVVLVATPMALLCFHLGPKLGFEKEPKTLCTFTLSDGSRLFLIQKRNNSLLEAYSSLLYRIYPDGRAEVTGLGYEDSYWWLAKLHPARNGKDVEIRAWGLLAALYNPDSAVASWPGKRFPPAKAAPVPVADPIKVKLEQ